MELGEVVKFLGKLIGEEALRDLEWGRSYFWLKFEMIVLGTSSMTKLLIKLLDGKTKGNI